MTTALDALAFGLALFVLLLLFNSGEVNPAIPVGGGVLFYLADSVRRRRTR